MKQPLAPQCEVTVIHEETVRHVREHLPQEEALYDVAELFKAFADTTRVRILWALSQAEMCVCDLAALLGMTSTAVSHQLRFLKQARLVRNRRTGRVVYYSLCDEHVMLMLNQAMEHVQEGG